MAIARPVSDYVPAIKYGANLDVQVDLADLVDVNGNEILEIDAVDSAVNYIRVANSATGNAPLLSAQGSDTNVGFDITTKGTGAVLITSAATTGNAVDIAAASVTTGKGLDMSDLNALTTGIGVDIVSSSTGLTTAGNLLHVHASGDFNDAAGQVVEIESAHTTGTGLQLTMTGLTDGIAVDISAPAITTGTLIDMGALDTVTTGKAVNIQGTGEAHTSGILLDVGHTGSGSLAAMTGNVAKFASSLTSTDTSGTDTEDYDTVLISRTHIMNGAGGTLNGDGAALKIETVATETAGTSVDESLAIEIVHQQHSDAATVYAIGITSDNSGTAAAGGIDLSSMAAGEATINFVDGNASSIDPSATAETGWLNIAVGGTIRYVPYYAVS